MTDFPDLKIKALVNFPADAIGDAGIDINKIDGRYHLALGYGDFLPLITGVTDPLNQTVLIWNAATEEYKLASINVLTGAGAEFNNLIGTQPYLNMQAASGVLTIGPWIYASMSRGTLAGPVPITIGDKPFGISVSGYDGDEFRTSAQLFAVVEGAVSNDIVPMSWIFATGDSSVGPITPLLKIAHTGEVMINTMTSPTSAPANLSIVTHGTTDWGLAIVGADTGGYGCFAAFAATKNLDPNVHTLVTNGSWLSTFRFQGSDGAAFRNAATIQVAVDGVAAAGSVPGLIRFETTPVGALDPIARLEINNQGHGIWRSATATPPTLLNNGDWVLTPTSNTQFRISYRGSDGVTRTGNITLAP